MIGAMDAREDVVKGDQAVEEEASFGASGGELAGLQSVGQGGRVDFGVQGSTELVGADLLPQGLLRPAGGSTGFDSSPDLGGVSSTELRPRARARRIRAGGVYDHAVGAPVPVGGVGVGELGSPDQPERPLVGMEDVVGVPGADQRAPLPAPPAGRRADRHGLENDLQFRHVDAVGVMAMRSAALLAMFGAAMALIGEQDASWRNQFRTIMFWLAGCVGLFRWILFLSRR
ncbi:hypothetical protein SEVIR_1G225601v4 [Setaria viridis]|uniref:Uncharacterized protein n=1 Tax=Setaria viridis TaxID=4556 RepID=A0A4V6DD32_SETVI|nr:hypothetical protein SEVIR_1G225601v2 [Setaria viridis]